MDKRQFCKFLRSLYFKFAPDEAFQISVNIIEALEDNQDISHDLALYGLKFSKAYLDLMGV